jgi:hypothetical protein
MHQCQLIGSQLDWVPCSNCISFAENHFAKNSSQKFFRRKTFDRKKVAENLFVENFLSSLVITHSTSPTLTACYSRDTPVILHSTPLLFQRYSTLLLPYFACTPNFFWSRWSHAFSPLLDILSISLMCVSPMYLNLASLSPEHRSIYLMKL